MRPRSAGNPSGQMPTFSQDGAGTRCVEKQSRASAAETAQGIARRHDQHAEKQHEPRRASVAPFTGGAATAAGIGRAPASPPAASLTTDCQRSHDAGTDTRLENRPVHADCESRKLVAIAASVDSFLSHRILMAIVRARKLLWCVAGVFVANGGKTRRDDCGATRVAVLHRLVLARVSRTRAYARRKR